MVGWLLNMAVINWVREFSLLRIYSDTTETSLTICYCVFGYFDYKNNFITYF